MNTIKARAAFVSLGYLTFFFIKCFFIYYIRMPLCFNESCKAQQRASWSSGFNVKVFWRRSKFGENKKEQILEYTLHKNKFLQIITMLFHLLPVGEEDRMKLWMYAFTNVAIRNWQSNLSMMPPCPGIMSPKS